MSATVVVRGRGRRAAAHDALPLLEGGSRVLVDGWPICLTCGRPVEAVGPGRWRHTWPGRPPQRSKWLPPTLAELRDCRTYAQFAARYPWAVRADGGGRFATSEVQWREGVERLERYEARLEALRRTRALHPGKNPYLELVRLLAAPPAPTDDPLEQFLAGAQPRVLGLPFGLAQVLDVAARRRELVDLFAWAIPNEEALAALARHAPLVEAAAGTGYWAALLRARGVDLLAYDPAPPGDAPNEYHESAGRTWTDVRLGSAASAVRRLPERTLVLCWPPYDDDAASYAPLRAYRGDVVIFVGERGGAAGSVPFHRELELNWTVVEEVDLPHWPRLDDRVYVYRRNPVRRPHRRRDRCNECRRFVPSGSLGRCDACFERRPPALALRVGRHRAEYTEDMLERLPPVLRTAFETSPSRIVVQSR